MRRPKERSDSGLAGADRVVAALDQAAQRARSQTRGSGDALAALYQSELAVLGSLPGGTASLPYAQLSAKLRDAERLAFDQHDAEEYALPHLRLQGEIARAQLLPFAPSDRYALEIANLGVDTREVSRLTAFLQQRRAAGRLSEREEKELTGRIEGIKTDEARTVALLSEGMEDRLPALSAGRPAAFARYDSLQLAALHLAQRGNPNRAYGAIDGAQLQLQHESSAALPIAALPAPTGGSVDLSLLTGVLQRLTEAILHGGGRSGSPLHPGEAAGGLHGLLQSAHLPNRPTGYN